MKFCCYKSDLKEAVQFAMRAVANKPQTPVLSGIYIKTEGTMLELQSNNFSVGIAAKIPVNVEVPGATVVSGKKFMEFVRNMPDDTITIEESENVLSLKSGGATVDLLTMSPDDFPKVETLGSETGFKIKAGSLKNLIRRTVFSVARGNDRPLFTGCCFEIKDNEIISTATNAHRLAQYKENLVGEYPSCKFVVPAETLSGILSRLDGVAADDFIEVNYNVQKVSFMFESVLVTSRLLAGEFPPVDKVIPKETATQIEVATAELKAAADFVSLMSKETEYNTVKFVIDDYGLEVSANSPEAGGAVKNVEAKFSGEDLEIAFNVDYITDALKVVDSPKLKLEFNDRFSPMLLIEPDNPNFIYVATPVRTS